MGGGGSKANVTQEAVTNLLQDVIVKNMQNASVTSSLTQDVNIVNSGEIKDLQITQGLTFKSEIFQSAQNMADLQNSLKSALEGAASATGSGVFSALGGSKSNLTQRIINDIQNNVNMQTMQDVSTTITQVQNVNLINTQTGKIKGLTIDQAQGVYRNAAQQIVAKFSSINDISNDAKGKSDAVTKNPISEIIDSVFSGITGVWIIIAVIFIVVCIVGYFAMKTVLGSDPETIERISNVARRRVR
jgi:hypothetical protein